MIRFFVRHPVSTWMLFAALIFMGLYALPKLDIEAMPETDLPSLTIYTRWNGASPSAIQRSITIPIEEAAQKLHGVEEISARSSPGRSEVEVSFRRDVDIEFARLELSEQLGAVRRNLPSTAGQPVIVPYVPEEFRTDDFFTFSLVSPLPTNELREKAETWLLPRLLSISGVADAELQGGARPLIKILLDMSLMERYGLTADAVFNRVAALDDIIPAGAIRRSGMEFTVSVSDSVVLDRLPTTIIRTLGGQPITLGHIAEIEEGYEDPAYFVRINGENVIQANVAKRSGENAVAVSKRIRESLPGLEESLPFPVKFEIDSDQGEELEEKLEELVYRSLIILGLLFMFLALALRRVRITGIVVFSILLAIVICLALFYFFGISVNFITISGLTVCFGMLLDNSILVLDAIHRRLSRVRNEAISEALVDGTREVGFPIIATTLTTVVAFLSFIFLSGRLSLFYVPLAMSVAIAMLASIFVALCWLPVALRGPARREALVDAPSEKESNLGYRFLMKWIVAVVILALVASSVYGILEGMDEILDHWLWVAGISGLLVLTGCFVSFVEGITSFHLKVWPYPIVLMFALFYGAWYVFDNEIDQGGFWRRPDEERLRLYMERPVGTDVVLSTETMKLFENELLPIPEGIHLKSTSWENRGYLEVRFEQDRLRSEYPELYRNRLILLAEELGGMFVWIGGFGDPYLKGGRGGGISNSLVKITGYNSKVLDEICNGVMARLERNRRVRNVRLTSGQRFERDASDETVVIIHRDQLVHYHLSMGEVLAYLRRLLGIDTPWNMIVEGKDQRLQLAFKDAKDIQYDQVMNKVIVTRDNERVHLSDLISVETRPVIGTILRENQRYARQINWEYIGTDRMRRSFISEIVSGIELPYGYTAEDVSNEPLTEEEEEEMATVLWVTLLFIFMTLAALFESMTLPLLVILSIPMALTGVVGLFWATDSTFDSSAKIGLVLLFGIVVNNAILLVNRFRLQVRELVAERGYSTDQVKESSRLGGVDLWKLPTHERIGILREAICTGMKIQMRSILLTSGTTIAGLIPLLIRIADTTEGKDIWENLALSSIGGLASSTILILSAIPAMYWITTRFGWTVIRLWHRIRKFREKPTPTFTVRTANE